MLMNHSLFDSQVFGIMVLFLFERDSKLSLKTILKYLSLKTILNIFHLHFYENGRIYK